MLGGALLTTSGVLGGIVHITNHAFSKITLFLCAGSIYVSAHKTEVSQMSGLARQMPWTMGAFAAASLVWSAFHPRPGSSRNGTMALGSLEHGSTWVLGVLLASSLLSAAYLGPVVHKAYFEEAPDVELHKVREVPWMVVPLVVSAASSLLLGLFPDPVLRLAQRVVP